MSPSPPPDAALLTGRSRAHVTELPDLGCTLHRQVVEPFRALRAAAAREGIDLRVASSFRDFERQRLIWNDKFSGRRPLLDRAGRVLETSSLDAVSRVEAILVWSALPGASRHHWGTDLDIYDARALPDTAQLRLVPEEYAPGGPFEKLDRWLDTHLAAHGFFRPYRATPACAAPQTAAADGVAPEPWHISFAALAEAYRVALTPPLLAAALAGAELEGRDCVLQRIEDLHRRFVAKVAAPPAALLERELGEHGRVI